MKISLKQMVVRIVPATHPHKKIRGEPPPRWLYWSSIMNHQFYWSNCTQPDQMQIAKYYWHAYRVCRIGHSRLTKMARWIGRSRVKIGKTLDEDYILPSSFVTFLCWLISRYPRSTKSLKKERNKIAPLEFVIPINSVKGYTACAH